MKNINIITTILSFFFIVSCNSSNDNENGKIEPVTNAVATSFIGSVKLAWNIPSNSDYYYTLITYKNSYGEIAHEKVGRYDAVNGLTNTIVKGFDDTNMHDFILTNHSLSGASSSEVKVSGNPQDVSTAKDYVMGTVKVNPANLGASVVWTNESGVGVKLVTDYTDMKNIDQCDTVDAQKSDSLSLIGFQKTTNVSILAYNAKDGVKTTPKIFSVTPIVNADDFIYDNIEYFTLKVTKHQDIVTQDNPYNPYEYTVVTTGADPNENINPLKNAKAGTTLKFRYQATQNWDLQLYWINKGGSASASKATTVTIPAASTWTTFTYNYGSEMTKYSWKGNVGDFFRMDWGGNSGVTIHIRNIHFE